MSNFLTKIFSRPPEPSIPKIQPAIEVSEPLLPKDPPHVHSFELITKTVAEASSIIPKSPDNFVPSSAVLGCTSYLWECSECGGLRKEMLLGSEEPTLVSILRKVDEQGTVSVLRDGKKYLIGAVEEPRPGTLPVR